MCQALFWVLEKTRVNIMSVRGKDHEKNKAGKGNRNAMEW